MNITGNTILITGGGTGIGRGLAEALHTAGNTVIIVGRRPAPLQAVTAAHPGMHFALLDIDDAFALRDFADRILVEHPGLNVLINDAGIMRVERVLAGPEALAVAEATITTNLLGPIRLTSALLPQLLAQPQAAVVNVSSGLAFVPRADTPTYSATKAAIHSYSISLRHQLRDTAVQVIEVAPPLVATDLTPGQRDNPRAMPLEDFIRESMGLLAADPEAAEILVERVKSLRTAEATGRFATMFDLINPR
ncbi:SDR family oxidoreductase [Pseudaminobacter sp. 19-2017]|uniref:SDR family oxidoreductase n=1 Tax=Pseudaminobacter soli (ex Zhang et al. 2022) TaxID=2831468 RepID=A0A942I440_9HYPH|nr:SDR family NAD(P)-dependent oxidoreductase [Pseudaminobacter soli]MBS3652262.1 SDR family oxidoreductase [Pseudaminobacter soli]